MVFLYNYFASISLKFFADSNSDSFLSFVASNFTILKIICSTYPIKKTDITVPMPTLPPQSQPTARAKNSVLFTVPNLTSKDFSNFAKSAGCKLFADAGTTVYADSRLIGIFPSNEVEINLDGSYKEIISGRIYENCAVKLCEKGAAVFIKED